MSCMLSYGISFTFGRVSGLNVKNICLERGAYIYDSLPVFEKKVCKEA